MAYKMTWLAGVLRSAGLKVEEVEGWQDRGRAEMGTVKGIICHHTASAAGSGNHPALDLVKNGRPDLAGPLSHLLLARDGTFFVIAAGRCNHAGEGLWHGVTGGNTSMIGIEAENAGTGHEPWPDDQIEAYARGCAAILTHIGADDVMCAGHKEYALPKGRKIDPSFDMVAFRENVETHMVAMKTPAPSTVVVLKPVASTDPARAMLFKGAQGKDVELLQEKLGIKIDGAFGPGTDKAVRAFQKAHGLLDDGKVGPATWKALGVG